MRLRTALPLTDALRLHLTATMPESASPNSRLRPESLADSLDEEDTGEPATADGQPADSVVVSVGISADTREGSSAISAEDGQGLARASDGSSKTEVRAHSPELAVCFSCKTPHTASAAAAASASASAPNSPSAQDGAEDECIVCFMPLSEEPVDVLQCQHRFHATCIREWIRKDGRCPVCRHVEDEAAAAAAQIRSRRPTDSGFSDWTGRTSLLTTRLMLSEARRLVALASVEATISVLVLSYVGKRDLVSPIVMFLTALVMMFTGSRFSVRGAALCRPLLAFNIVYHVWMCMHMVQQYEDVDLFSREGAGLRAAVVTIICVVVLETLSFKSAGIFYLRLLSCSQLQLTTFRRIRRPYDGWHQRLFLIALFLLIFAPVLIRSLCLNWTDFSSTGEELCRSGADWAPGGNINATLAPNATFNRSAGLA